MPDRRTFLISFSSVVVAPVFAQLALPPTAAHGVQWTAGAMAGSTADAAGASKIALRIDGWDTPDASAPNPHGDAWIRINSSWKAAWR